MNNTSKTSLSIIQALARYQVWLIIGIVWACVAFAPGILPGPGLTAPQPMKKFLNGTLPTSTPDQVIGYQVVEAFPNMIADSTLVFVPEPGTNRIIIGSRRGYYEAFDNNPAVTTAQKVPFLDLSARTAVVWDGGNLGMTFHPGYPGTPYVYVWYNALVEGTGSQSTWGSGENTTFSDDVFLRLSRFTVANGTADPASELVMINVHLYNSSHRGGGMGWDSDGNLLVTMGEQFTGSTAQVITNNFQGGWIRIDVDQRGPSHPTAPSHVPKRIVQIDPTYNASTTTNGFLGHYIASEPASQADMANPAFLANPDKEFTGRGYYIPDDNPDWGALAALKGVTLNDGDYFEEYCTIGNRNPHRMTQDMVGGRFWGGEVGAGSREEINVLETDEVSAGINFGWPAKEGNLGTYPANYLGTRKDPVTDFLRSEANAIIGGYVYRGTALPGLVGKYICGGYAQQRIFAVSYTEDGSGHVANISREEIAAFTPGSLITFGQDHAGEIYLCRQGSNTKIYKLQAIGNAVPAPALLSEIDVFNRNGANGASGTFAGISTLTPRPGLIPYELNVPFWSDGALKFRYLAVPNDEDNNGVHDKPDEKIIFSENGEWQFPQGTVLVKHFELPIDENNPTVTKRLETRFIVHGDDGNYYYLTYKWRTDNSDADLLDMGTTENISIALAGGGTRQQVWQYPSRTECQQCHNQAAGSVLGAKTRQLNRNTNYSSIGGTIGNQLETYNSLAMFAGTPFQISQIPTFLTLSPTAGTDPLEARARSYLDANCSYCHRPGTGNRAIFDARITTDLEFQYLIYGPLNVDLGDPLNRVIVPMDVGHSVLHTRMNSTTPGIVMPPLAKNEVDVVGTALIAQWISTLDQNFQAPCAGLQADYFNNTTLTGPPVLTRIVPTVNFDFSTGSPDPLVNVDNFSTRYSGTVLPPEDGTYTFYATADDGVRLWVDGQQLVDAWIPQGPTTYSGTISLVQGMEVPIVLEHYEAAGGAVIRLEWAHGVTTQSIIPQTSLCIGDGTTLAQTITFPMINDRCLTDPATFALGATASSGLPVTYSVTGGNQYVSIVGNTLTIEVSNITTIPLPLPVTITIEANQTGDATYDPALTQVQSFVLDNDNGNFSLVTNGAAARDGCTDCYIITPDVANAAGTAWTATKLITDLDQSFRLTLTVNLGTKDATGGDGMTFALQNISNTFVGSNGTPMAVNGLAPSFGVEFDTYQSTGGFDPPADHISFWAAGNVAAPLQPPVQASPLSTNIEDGQPHTVILEWDPAVNLFSVQFDGSLRDVYSGNIRTLLGGATEAYFGFGAGTGGATNEHKACIQSLEIGVPIFSVAVATTDANCGMADGTATASVSGGTGSLSYQWSAGTISGNGTISSNLGPGTYNVTVTDSATPTPNSKTVAFTIGNIPGQTLATSSQNSDCGQSNGTATVNVTGGTSPYTYTWSAGTPTNNGNSSTSAGLPGGTYSVTVTDDNLCEAITTVNVIETAPFTLSFVTQPATCGLSDGTVSVTANGATGTLTFLWGPNTDIGSGPQTNAQATGLSAGTYAVTVTENGTCEVIGSVVLGQIGCPTLAINGTATADAGNCYTLTTTTPNNQAGTIWSQTLLDLTKSFILEGELFFGNDVSGNNMAGADGLAFALQKDTRGTAAIGGYGGSYAISLVNGTLAVTPSFGIEFDTYPNGGEPAFDHLSFWGNGNVYAPLQAAVQASPTSTNIEDNAFHDVKIEWNPVLNELSVYLDNVLRDTYTGDIVSTFFGGDNMVYWGFGGGTGGATNLQQFCFNSLEIGAAAMMLDVAQTNVNCDQPTGSATVTVTGGTPPYSFSWSGNAPTSVDDAQNGTSTISALAPATYTVTVTDSGIYTANASVTITSTPGPAVAINTTDASCSTAADGTATAIPSAQGGSTNFTGYLWDIAANSQTTATATGLAPGSYSVTVTDDNGCTGSQTATVGAGTPFTLSFSSVPAPCGTTDGSATVTVVNGQSTYSYAWDDAPNNQTTPTATGLAPGTYNVTVTDNATSCTAAGSVSVGSACPTLSTAGTATNDGGNCYTLTTEAPLNQAGAIWSDVTVNLNNHFELTGSIYLGNGDPSANNMDFADGMTFAFQADPRGVTALGGNGTAMAVSGVVPSFGAEFDTYPGGAYDLTADHISFWSGGAVISPLQPPVPIVDAFAVVQNVEDGAFHPILIEWNPDLLEFSVTFDGVLQDTYEGDIRSFFTDPTQVRWGFGGGTGGKVNLQQFCLNNLVITPPAYSVAVTSTPDICGQGGSATAAPAGGIGTYTYLWNDGTAQTTSTATSLSVGTYRVTVIDDGGNGSEVRRIVTVNEILGPTLSVISTTNASCGGSDGTATVAAADQGGSTAFTYAWDDATPPNNQTTATATGLAPGTYGVTATDGNNCQATQTVVIGELAGFSIDFTTVLPVTASCGGLDGEATVTATGASGAVTYLWDTAAGSQTTATAVGLAKGTYSVTVTDASTCSVSGSVTIGDNCLLLVNGNAVSDGGDCYTLTPQLNNQVGTAWSRTTVSLTENFRLEADLYLGNDVSGGNTAGADGIAFAFHADTRGTAALGGYGGSFGIDDINGAGRPAVAPSFGMSFKTYPSAGFPGDYVYFWENANVATALGTRECIIEDAGGNCANAEDNQTHNVLIQWDATNMIMTVFVDGSLRNTYTGDIATLIGTTQVYWGFGAGTGGANNRHEVCVISQESNGTLTQYLDFPEISDVCFDEAPITLGATASSGAPITYNILDGDPYVNIAGNTMTIDVANIANSNLPLPAMVTIQAVQNGSGIYNAVQAEQSFQIDLPMNIVFNPYGSAVLDPDPDGCECYILTQDAPNQAGTIWSDKTLDMDHHFSFEFNIFMSFDGSADNRDRADGITFALQNDDPAHLGTLGSAMGVDGLPHSFGLEFDNYAAAANVLPPNTPYDPQAPTLYELLEDHLSFWKGGDLTVPLAGPVVVNVAKPNFEDARYHRVKMDWDPATQTMTATFDGTQVLSYTAIGNSPNDNLVADYLGGNSLVHFGFGAGTGGKTSLQKVCLVQLCRDVTFDITALLQGPFNSGNGLMNDLLRTTLDQNNQPLIPLIDPYGQNETVLSIPADVVDWVLVEVRQPDNPAKVAAQRACFITKTGAIIDTDGTPGVTFPDLCLSEAYLTVRHRNHLGVMTANPLSLLFAKIVVLP